jgi:ribonuclease HII
MNVSQAEQQARIIAGVDEAGRGPLAGPVVVAAVVLDPAKPIRGLADSKTLRATLRTKLAEQIKQKALCYCVIEVSSDEIDQHNILGATLLGMTAAIIGLPVAIDFALIDGNRLPNNLPCPARAIIAGDTSEPSISAASILAKVARDEIMLQMSLIYPAYGFSLHKGYPTAAHQAALRAHGPCPIHRRSFAPVRASLKPDLFAIT